MPDAPTILLVENDEEAFRALSHALRALTPAPRLAWACGVGDAVAYLQGDDGYADRKFFPLPDFVLLDLKTPPTAALEWVSWLRAHGEFHSLPVLTLSAGGDEFDAARALAAGVTAYFLRPCDEARLSELLEAIVAHARTGAAVRCSSWPGAVALPAQSCAA